MNVIITGGTGFLGNALVSELVDNGDNVTAIVRPGSKRIDKIKKYPNVRIVETSLDEEIILPDEKYDVFYHLAWEGERDNFDEQYKNVHRSLNCINAAVRFGCRRFICTGSQAEYGETSELITEETPTRPTTSYGSAKVSAYYLTKDIARHYGIEHIWVRVFSVYGDNDNPNTLYSQLLNALRNNEEFKMTTDGKHMWNFLHETDAAHALRLISSNNVNEGIYNLASKISRPLFEYVDIFKSHIDTQCIVKYGDYRSKNNLYTMSEKLRNTIGEYEKN